MDRLGFWGPDVRAHAAPGYGFQYPLMDRLGFWGRGCIGPRCRKRDFSIR